MDDLHLSETLQRYFSDIYVLCCENDEANIPTSSSSSNSRANISKTVDLMKSGSVPEDVIIQIGEICEWNERSNPPLLLDVNSLSKSESNSLNRYQFFAALKLVAAYQSNIPVHEDILNAKLDLPLPRFKFCSHNEEVDEDDESDLIELKSDASEHLDTLSTSSTTDSEVDSDTLCIPHGTGSPSGASDSPTPTNSVQDRNWVIGANSWTGLVSEEQRQLLGTEEESSDKHSSEEDAEISPEVWEITAEQREYYTKQFRSLQPDLNGLLAGPVARMFFEKSRLPVQELRKIWQLSDVTKDGALSLQEFNTAMHLVVLRRNHIELPDSLPPSLIPSINTGNNNTNHNNSNTNKKMESKSSKLEENLPPNDDLNENDLDKDKIKDKGTIPNREWTKFVESPTNSSSISSPGPKPVNFDFQKVNLDKDPKILHPVALRVTPEMQQQILSNCQDVDGSVTGAGGSNSPKFVDLQSNNQNQSVIQRPQPKKILPGALGAIPPPPVTAINNESTDNGDNSKMTASAGPISLPAFTKKEKPPPPPPPRPFKTHGRSSSLDLNKLSKLGAPPTVPPRISPNITSARNRLINQKSEGDCVQPPTAAAASNFADFDAQFEQFENVDSDGTTEIFPGDVYEQQRRKLFAQFENGASNLDDTNDCGPPQRHGAFEIYRKPAAAAPAAATINKKENSLIKEEQQQMWDVFVRLQDENTVLLRMCQELSQQLADIKEEKLLLKIRLEKQQQHQQQANNGT